MELAFYGSSVVAILATLGVISGTNPMHALLYLIVSLIAVGMIFFSLGASFVGAMQVIVYAGAIMVLFVFVVMMLNQVFSRFDELVRQHGVEKIKTLGDGYMAVAHDGSGGLCDLALAMHESLVDYNRANGTDLQVRIGIHAGPAVAGVIGKRRPLYDAWGDTVNVASRLESVAPPGATLVSGRRPLPCQVMPSSYWSTMW